MFICTPGIGFSLATSKVIYLQVRKRIYSSLFSIIGLAPHRPLPNDTYNYVISPRLSPIRSMKKQRDSRRIIVVQNIHYYFGHVGTSALNRIDIAPLIARQAASLRFQGNAAPRAIATFPGDNTAKSTVKVCAR